MKTPAFQSGLFTPHVLVAFALCSFGVLLGMFGLAATPPVVPPITNHYSPITSSSPSAPNADRLPPGVPLPPSGLDAPPASARRATAQRGRKPDTQFSLNRNGVPASSSPTAGFPPPARKPSGLDAPPGWKPAAASGINSLGHPALANQQPMPLA